jgi:Zn-dependent protease with chaperone function
MSCPLCGRATPADQFGFVECGCGWGGPGDPLEGMRPSVRRFALLDRRIAARAARRELARIARNKSASGASSLLYIALLSMLSTLIYLAIGGLLVGSLVLLVFYAMGGFWLGFALDGAIALYLFWALFGLPSRVYGIVARTGAYPQLAAILGEVGGCVGVKAPTWVIVYPGAGFYVTRRMLWGRAPLPQRVVGVGAASLALLNDHELRAILAHELAHYQHEHTFFGRFFGGAESALRHIIDGLRAGIDHNYSGGHARMNSAFGNLGEAIGTAVVWVVTIPLRIVWFIFHMVRLRLSRANEYEADATAVERYGAQAFINGLTAVRATAETMRGARLGIRQEMAWRDNPNFFSELRRHYAELPASYMGPLRMKTLRGFRSLEDSHPITPDRVRAALMLGAPESPAAQPATPAYSAITPAGAADTETIERQLTALLFGGGRRRR